MNMYWPLMLGLFLLVNTSIGCRPPAFSQLPVQQDYNVYRAIGFWYTVKWYASGSNTAAVPRDDIQLVQLRNDNPKRLLVFGRARDANTKNCFSYGPWLIDANNGAKLVLQKRDLSSTTNLNQPFYILQIDYEHYALAYTCATPNYVLNQPCENRILLLFSRRKVLASKYLRKAERYITKFLCIDLRDLQTNAFRQPSCFPTDDDNSHSSE
ncbi:unnamed protein product [Rotaria sp. Silwood1]|nr:unnamed protein product [Rotaria sp. Silwood1]CAF5066161.1 unnamed protein product [Rotaria sp. Silwood1]